MSYLICDRCGSYYELKMGEHPEDFNRCNCGGKMIPEELIAEGSDSYLSKFSFKMPSILNNVNISMIPWFIAIFFFIFTFIFSIFPKLFSYIHAEYFWGFMPALISILYIFIRILSRRKY
jgi:hypothetical protein